MRFDTFWDAVNNLFTEPQAAAHEHRQEEFLCLPFAISVWDLINCVKGQCPNIDLPFE